MKQQIFIEFVNLKAMGERKKKNSTWIFLPSYRIVTFFVQELNSLGLSKRLSGKENTERWGEQSSMGRKNM